MKALIRPWNMLKQAKQAFLKTARASGIFSAVMASSWRAHRLLILGYHGVSLQDEHLWHPDLYLSKETFRQRMQVLQGNRCQVLPLAAALQALRADSLPPRAVVITVDDGLFDFYACAWPILKEFGFPATVYQTTYYSSNPLPVFDLIASYVLWKGRERSIDGEEFTGKAGELDLSTFDSRQAVVARLRAFVVAKELSAQDKDRMARALAARLNVDYDAILRSRIGQLMSPAEVADIVRAGIDVQLHTHRHRTPSDAALFTREIEDNRAALRACGVQHADHFCYPSGIFSPEFLPTLREAGVVSATTCEYGFTTSASDPLLLPRLMDTGRLSRIEFEGWVTGVSALLPARQSHREPNLY